VGLVGQRRDEAETGAEAGVGMQAARRQGRREVDKGRRSHAFPLTHDPSRIRGSKKQCLCEARGLTGKFESRAPSQLLLKMAKFMVSVDGWALI
jgi:hypothetical protein